MYLEPPLALCSRSIACALGRGTSRSRAERGHNKRAHPVTDSSVTTLRISLVQPIELASWSGSEKETNGTTLIFFLHLISI